MNTSDKSWFDASERAAVDDFWQVYGPSYDRFFAHLIGRASNDPALASVVKSLEPHQLVALRDASRERIERALHGDIDDYVAALRREAIAWAHHGVGFSQWYVVRCAMSDFLMPLLVEAYGATPARLVEALRVMSKYLDRMMMVLGNEYVAAKEDALRETEGDLATTLESIGDAVIATDVEGRIVRMNSVAQVLTGFTLERARHKRLEEVFVTACEDTNTARPSAVERVLRGGAFVGDDRSILLAKDGRRCAVTESGAAIREADGRIRGVVIVFRDQTEERKVQDEIRSSREQLRALAGRLQNAREEEGRRIAREVHDALGQSLTALKLDVGWLGQRVEKIADTAQKDELVERCGSVLETIAGAMRSVRRIASELRPPALDDLGLGAALESQLRDFERRTSIATNLDIPGEELPLDTDHATALFRVIQEALTNVARHAEASRVNVALATEADAVVLVVEDDGKGFCAADVVKPGALGVVGMRERATLLGGTLELRTSPAGGTSVVVRLPFRPLEARAT